MLCWLTCLAFEINSERDDIRKQIKNILLGLDLLRLWKNFRTISRVMAIQQRMLTIMQGILNMVKEKKCLEFCAYGCCASQEVAGIQILIRQLSKDGKLFARGASDDKDNGLLLRLAIENYQRIGFIDI